MDRQRKNFFLLYFTLAQIILVFSNLPWFERARSVPVGTIPTLQHHHVVTEYPGYIAYIRQGRDGAWQMHDLYTTEETSPTNLYLYYILLGKICRIIGISPTAIYHLMRFLQFELISVLTFFLCMRLLGTKAGFAAAILALTGSPPSIFWPAQIPAMEGIGWHPWSVLHPFRNADMIPHHGASTVLMLVEIHLILTATKTMSLPVSVIAGIVAFFSFLFHPVSGLVFVIAQPLSAAYQTAIDFIKIRKLKLKWIIIMFPPVIFSLLALLLITYDVSNSFPYNQFRDFDVIWYDRYNPYYIPLFEKGGGLLLVSGALSSIYIFLKKKLEWILVLFWGLLPFIVIPIGSQLHIAKFRFAFLLPFIPLSLVTVYAGQRLFTEIRHHKLRIIILILLIGIYSLVTVKSMALLYTDWKIQTGKLEPGMYVTRDFLDAVSYLSDSAPENSRIFTGEINGILIPAYAQTITYVGQTMQTLNWEAKKIIVREFFGGYFPKEEAAGVIKDSRIDYIFYGPVEKEWGEAHLSYGLNLSKVYENSTITIYRVD